jgi:hypothetical protein
MTDPRVVPRLDRGTQYSRDDSDSSRSRAVLDRPPARTMTLNELLPLSTTRSFPFSRRVASELSTSMSLFRQRAQGRPGAGWHPRSACSKKARGRTTGSAENTRPSLRDGFNGCFVLSPGTGVLAPVARETSPRTWHQHRDARTTRLDRPRQPVRPHGLKPRCELSRPPHPRPAYRDDRAYAPSCRDRMRMHSTIFSGKAKTSRR